MRVLVNFSAPTNASGPSPYMDFTLDVAWRSGGLQPPDISPIAAQAGLNAMTPAFITAEGTSCEPAWGGYSAYPVGEFGLQSISDFQKAGGKVRISFGGAIGNYLEKTCEDADSLASAIKKVIDTYNVKDLDFDIEGQNLEDTAAITRLTQALAQLQNANPDITVSVTLPVLPTGLTAEGVRAVKLFQQAGVKFKVNIMAMDYGSSFNPGTMGQNAIDALQATHNQLRNIYPQDIYPNVSSDDLWKMLIVTPMIGINDIQPERFTQADAELIREFCEKMGVEIRYWDINRDHPCMLTSPDNHCSGAFGGVPMQTANYSYARSFSAKGAALITMMQISENLLPVISAMSQTAGNWDSANWILAAKIVGGTMAALGGLAGGVVVVRRYGSQVATKVGSLVSGLWSSGESTKPEEASETPSVCAVPMGST